MQKWKSFKTAPKDGTPVIFWLSSDTFEDTTANFYYDDGQWYWECDDSPLQRPDLVNGWMLYPQPPARKKLAKRPNSTTRAAFRETTKPLPAYKNFHELKGRP